ncbi:S8 family serine peptidase [Microbacterium rhizomatis]|uniref:S8/S53 family peptidase n=1 Tax=Microbacterium rhizomatis TaxID=1631477 RepID=A0A5J5IWA0_9MICO|nr:S8 family serine peptidase [Microbacterium rhizomatis]KAA9105049.1 S8/S53 family peptidase [Microbacterium rhizomatis]
MTGPDGALATSGDASENFLRTAFDPSSGELRVARTGRIWEAILTAQDAGRQGAGALVAILDGEFDLTMIPAGRVHPASQVAASPPSETGRHGTVVALLVLAAAPAAQVLLIDVMAGPFVRPDKVAAGLARAAECGAAIVNLSVEFPTDCSRRDATWIDSSLALEIDPDPARFLPQVDAWIAHAEPYAGSRCARACEVCDALGRLPDGVLVVAASGNIRDQVCPACFAGAVGVGFQRTQRVDVGGVVITASGLPETSMGSLVTPELVVEEPPGFRGTSFASPLVAGLAATLADPAEFVATARLPFALSPLLMLANLFAQHPESVTARAVATLHEGFLRFAAAIPAPHRHWEEASVTSPCALCALLLVDWYDAFSASLLAGSSEEGIERGLGIARIAAVLAPRSASTAGNVGAGWKRSADFVTGPERAARLERAHTYFARAAELAPEVAVYGTLRDGLAHPAPPDSRSRPDR